jgi:hypothetical protein
MTLIHVTTPQDCIDQQNLRKACGVHRPTVGNKQMIARSEASGGGDQTGLMSNGQKQAKRVCENDSSRRTG